MGGDVARAAIRDLESAFVSLAACCLHDPLWTPADVESVLGSAWRGDESGGWQRGGYGDKDAAESQSVTVVRLKDGRFGLLDESEDYTGHGCQCGASATAYASLPELQRMGVPEYGGAREAIAQACANPGSVVREAAIEA